MSYLFAVSLVVILACAGSTKENKAVDSTSSESAASSGSAKDKPVYTEKSASCISPMNDNGTSQGCPGAENPDQVMRPSIIIPMYGKIEKGILKFRYKHSGGCKPHAYRLYFMKLEGCQVHVEFVHDNNGDKCEASVTKELAFDMRTIPIPDGCTTLEFMTSASGVPNLIPISQS